MIRHTLINHQARVTLGLSPNEYLVADIIYSLGNEQRNAHDRWVKIDMDELKLFTSLSQEHIDQIILLLCKIGLLEKADSSHLLLRTTLNWYDSVIVSQKERN